jgi:chitin disaccharide deacetylase
VAIALEQVGAQQPAGQQESGRRIWLCADDYGISLAVNAAIRDLVVRGRINATSVMTVAPSLTRSEAVSLNMLNAGGRRVALGLHVTLTGPFRPLSKEFAPLADGAFVALEDLLKAALMRRLKPALLDAEARAQLAAFVAAFGRPPDFVDGHRHVHLFPQVRDAVLAAAKELAPDAWVRQCGSNAPLLQRFSDPKGLLVDWLSRTLRHHAAALGVPVNPAFAGTYTYREGADFAALFPKFLAAIPEAGVIMCHPGVVDAELERLDPLTTLREREYAYFLDDTFPAILAKHGVTLA